MVDLVPVHSGSILSLVSLCVISFGTSLCLQRLSVVCRKGNAAMISFPVFTLNRKTSQWEKHFYPNTLSLLSFSRKPIICSQSPCFTFQKLGEWDLCAAKSLQCTSSSTVNDPCWYNLNCCLIGADAIVLHLYLLPLLHFSHTVTDVMHFQQKVTFVQDGLIRKGLLFWTDDYIYFASIRPSFAGPIRIFIQILTEN